MAELLNKNIKHLRSKKGISQQALADKIGIDRSTISRIENNEIETTIDNAIKIADVLNVTVSDLINKDLSIDNKQDYFDELDLLWSKHKDILNEDDKEMLKFMFEKRMREIDEQQGKE